jgi:hypothetical protein
MKILILLLNLILSTSLPAVVLSVNFDATAGNLGRIHQEGALAFQSPSDLLSVDGRAAYQWDLGTPYAYGRALAVYNNDWLTVSSATPLTSFSFLLGFDWNGYAIAEGTLRVFLGWEAWLGGQLVDSAQFPTGGFGRYGVTLEPVEAFDTIKLRSITNRYGDTNHIAIDNVVAVTSEPAMAARFVSAEVPDSASTIALFATVTLLLLCLHEVKKETPRQ